jgi:hypothetical protein
LDGVQSPGTVTLSGHDRNKDWDIQAAKGSTGASTKLNGDPIGQFQASFFLSKDGTDEEDLDDFTRWEDFQRVIERSTNGPKPVALTIFHPDLLRNNITDVVSGGVGGFAWDGKGGAIVQVKFLEYKPPKPKATAGAKAKPATRTGVTTVEKTDPNARAKAELAGLVEEAKRP